MPLLLEEIQKGIERLVDKKCVSISTFCDKSFTTSKKTLKHIFKK
tara:strand:- start:408 stop:542 length:135 start_codon:yes stop_codon:yes gene_type:complete